MLWAMGAILLHFQAIPQAAVPTTDQVETIQAQALETGPVMVTDATASDETTPSEPGRLELTPVAPAGASAPVPRPAAPLMASVVAVPRLQPQAAGRLDTRPTKLWLGFSVAQHSAAAFDAWSTRRAITRGGAQELNPLLKPFANNNSIYAATQVAPTLLDLLGRRMMSSSNPLLRRTWWLPQVLGTVASVAGGVHNLGVN
jgi:hypothetical protein